MKNKSNVKKFSIANPEDAKKIEWLQAGKPDKIFVLADYVFSIKREKVRLIEPRGDFIAEAEAGIYLEGPDGVFKMQKHPDIVPFEFKWVDGLKRRGEEDQIARWQA